MTAITYDLYHGISNAWTDKRVIDIRTTEIEPLSVLFLAEVSTSPVDYSISYYRISDNFVRLVRPVTTSLNFQVVITYI